MDKSVVDNVTGETFKKAKTSMDLLKQAIASREGVGFKTYEECSEFSHEHNLDVMAYSPSIKGYYHVSHKGELLNEKYKSRFLDTLVIFD
jgi:hypothetical protein